jgi:hypothetical protein
VWNVIFCRRKIDREMGRFIDYLKEYNSPPKMWGGKGSSYKKLAEAYRQLGSVTRNAEVAKDAEVAAVEAENMSSATAGEDRDIDDGLEQIAVYCKSGRSPAEAWNMPTGELVWMNIAFAKLEGAKLPIWTPADEARMEHKKAERAVKIGEMADAIEAEEKIERKEALAWAAVRYWQQVVARVERG